MNQPIKKRSIAIVALLNSEQQVLIGKRPVDVHLGGLWEFPGGKVEQGETPQTALVRELQEELGIIVKEEDLEPITSITHQYDALHLTLHLFITHKWEGSMNCHVHDMLTWVPLDALADHPMPEANEKLLPSLFDYMTHNSLALT